MEARAEGKARTEPNVEAGEDDSSSAMALTDDPVGHHASTARRATIAAWTVGRGRDERLPGPTGGPVPLLEEGTA